MPAPLIHESAIVDEGATLGEDTRVWHFSHIAAGATIGERCVIGQNCYVASTARVGSGVKLQNNVSIYDGVVLEDDVFCGPSCVFTNVVNPRAFVDRKHEFRTTIVRRGASIGANATILCGVSLGEYSFVGAGAVVTKDVPAHSLVVGVPARHHGWVSRHGDRLLVRADGTAECKVTGDHYVITSTGVSRC